MTTFPSAGHPGFFAKLWSQVVQIKAPKPFVLPLRLRYFEHVLHTEFSAIDARRALRPAGLNQKPIAIRGQPSAKQDGRTPDHGALNARSLAHALPERIDPRRPATGKTRPRPVPSDAIGAALSGGGIRSAAVCLGALQALSRKGRIKSIDYLSTVSGGGYIGACLTAAMSRPQADFPFGEDTSDNPVISYLRNFSNYLLPRGRSAMRNLSETGAVILRGILANAIVALATILGFVLLTQLAYPNGESLLLGSFIPRLGWSVIFGAYSVEWQGNPFELTLAIAMLLAATLILWTIARSFTWLDRWVGDTSGVGIKSARFLVILTLVLAFLDFQPIAIGLFGVVYDKYVLQDHAAAGVKSLIAGLAAFGGLVTAVSGPLGRFLNASRRATAMGTLIRRAATHALLLAAAAALPLALWLIYLYLSAAVIYRWEPHWLSAATAKVEWLFPGFTWRWFPSEGARVTVVGFGILLILGAGFRANGYSLHRLYRDRLSSAFIFTLNQHDEPETRDPLKLSALRQATGPYHIINTAMNIQGSEEANKRGRGADFFMFTQDFVGSDLTMFAPTRELRPAGRFFRYDDVERADARIDLATAMAISGAAVSANMGSNTIRLLSPTLALLNVRLGYWLRNPRDLARGVTRNCMKSYTMAFSKFYLLLEMLNLLDEHSRHVYLSDGGHIENLGIYELLKRGCQLIVAVDAEADPTLSFPSLLKLERYARIDLGARIILPWEKIALVSKEVDKELQSAIFPKRRNGPHCAVGRIVYENGTEGILVYFKSSLTGDERDYILDYKRRHEAFPHETTGDQFFTEEQFETYRALGFHMVDEFFEGNDEFSFVSDARWPDAKAVKAEIASLLPAV